MRPIYENTVIQIDITNACHLACRHCTRHVGHHRTPYFMDLAYFAKAVDSIIQSPARIGIMGGEPTMHPRFSSILAILRDKVPPHRREFWTAGFRWGKFESEIRETFFPHLIAYNDHLSYGGRHAPLLVAINDVVHDEELKRQLIENCPYQSHWSASITPKGGFFCEIAASMDWLFEGPGGYDISDLRWWDRTPEQFKEQVERYCGSCSGAIPFPSHSDGRGGRDGDNADLVSPTNLARLRALGSRKIAAGKFELWDREIDRAFIEENAHLNPRAFRDFIAHEPKE